MADGLDKQDWEALREAGTEQDAPAGQVLVREGANLGVVAHQMAQLVDAVGHVLTPQLRDDLRRMNAMSGGGGR